MESRILLLGVISCIVQNSYTYPQNLGFSNMGNGIISGNPNIYNYPNNINVVGNSVGLNQIQNPAASSVATANIGQNPLDAAIGYNAQFDIASYGDAYLQNNILNNNAASASALSSINLNNLASNTLSANNLAQNILSNQPANLGSLGTSSVPAQSLARNLISAGTVSSLNNPVAYGAGLGGASVSISGAQAGSTAVADCPDGREVIGYVSFEGYLPVAGTVNVADNICDNNFQVSL